MAAGRTDHLRRAVFLSSLGLAIAAHSLAARLPAANPPDEKSLEAVKNLNLEYFQIQKLMGIKKYEQAIRRSQKLIERHHSFFKIYPTIVAASKEAKKLDLTIQYFREAAAKAPNNPAWPYGLGLSYKTQGSYDLAMSHLKRAVELQPDHIWPYWELIGSCNRDLEEMAAYLKAQLQSHPENSMFAYALGGFHEYKLKKYELAQSYYNQAVEIAKANGQTLQEAIHLNTLGNYHWGRSSFAKALEYYQRALETARATGDKENESSYLNNYGLIHCYTGNVAKGIEYYEESLKIDRETGDRAHEARVMRNIGQAQNQLGNFTAALGHFQSALRLAEEYADRVGQGRYLADIADIVYYVKGDHSPALASLERARRLSQEMNDPYNVAWCLIKTGNIYWRTGDYSRALEVYQEALEISKDIGNKEIGSICTGNIGLIHKETGDLPRALEFFQQALKIHRETGVKNSEGLTHNNIGLVYFAQGDSSRALSHLQQALQIARDIKDKKGESVRLANISDIHLKLGNHPQSHQALEESLRLAKEIGAKEREAFANLGLGALALKLEDDSGATGFYSSALALGQEMRIPAVVWRSYLGLATLEDKQSHFDQALAHYLEAIKTIEGVRARLQTEEQKAGFLRDKRQAYESLINLLLRIHQEDSARGCDREAFFYAEKAKARAFLDSLEEARLNPNERNAPEWRARESIILREISALQTDLARPNLPEERKQQLLAKMQEAEDSFQALTQKMKTANPDYANLVYPEPRRLEEVQERLPDKETALLEYFTGEETALLFLVTKTGFTVHSLGRSVELQERVKDFAKLLTMKDSANIREMAAGKRLFRELIGLAGEKLDRIRKLIILPDGSLHYLPFEALLRPNGHYLIEDLQISYAPSVSSLLHLLERKRPLMATRNLLAFADPVYSLARFPGSEIKREEFVREFSPDEGMALSPLRYSREEVKKIEQLIKKSRDVYVGEAAREEKLKEPSLKNYRIIHFATHGLLDETTPFRSALVLTLDEDPKEDGFFQAREVYGLGLNADLVVLSACRTGRGRLEKGEGVMGLPRAFLYAGAQAVLVSLWNINDRASSEFMQYFYQELVAGKSKTAALRQAKVRMIGSDFSHPFYWAAFVLSGDADSPVILSR